MDDEKRSPEAAKEHGVGKEDDNEGRYRVVDCTEQQPQMLALMVIVLVIAMVMAMVMAMAMAMAMAMVMVVVMVMVMGL